MTNKGFLCLYFLCFMIILISIQFLFFTNNDIILDKQNLAMNFANDLSSLAQQFNLKYEDIRHPRELRQLHHHSQGTRHKNNNNNNIEYDHQTQQDKDESLELAFADISFPKCNESKDSKVIVFSTDANKLQKPRVYYTCLSPLSSDIYEKNTGILLLKGDGGIRGTGGISGKGGDELPPLSSRYYPSVNEMPTNCGYGFLTFDTALKTWGCQCLDPRFFGGDFCDIPGPTLTGDEYNCRAVAQKNDIRNTNVATFDPLREGTCIECTNPLTMIPLIDVDRPSCAKIDDVVKTVGYSDLEDTTHSLRDLASDEEKEEKGDAREVTTLEKCQCDASNPARVGGLNNIFDETYGCACDYENGFVEVYIPGVSGEKTHNIISNACLKIGKTADVSSDWHRVDIAFYCLENQLKPIQVHSYTHLEAPFDKIFEAPNFQELLVLQPAMAKAHKLDWLNRKIKPTGGEKIRRLNYPAETWPIVNKSHLVNHYERRLETTNISTYDLNLGRGFEKKHWYETTNKRWLSNSVWGHPIVYGFHSREEVWNQKSTLNPLGPKYGQYYGITMKTQPGQIVRLDTRGYQQEKLH